MANYYIGVNVGAGVIDGTAEGSSSTGKDVEVVLNTTNVTTKEDLLLAIEKLEHYVATMTKWS